MAKIQTEDGTWVDPSFYNKAPGERDANGNLTGAGLEAQKQRIAAAVAKGAARNAAGGTPTRRRVRRRKRRRVAINMPGQPRQHRALDRTQRAMQRFVVNRMKQR